MQIFVLDYNPAVAARYHCDVHVNKLILEAVQILNGALHERDLDDHAFYGYTHKQHPCTLWAAESWGNFQWLVKLTHYLNKEFKFRYDNEDHHTSYRKLLSNWRHDGEWTLPCSNEERTPFALAMPDDVKSSDAVQSYRDYYREYKQPENWFGYERGRPAPKWLSTSRTYCSV